MALCGVGVKPPELQVLVANKNIISLPMDIIEKFLEGKRNYCAGVRISVLFGTIAYTSVYKKSNQAIPDRFTKCANSNNVRHCSI